jgi:AP-3 complex subunit delta-1
VGNIVRKFCIFLGYVLLLSDRGYSELAEPQKLLPHLLQPEINNLAPDIIATYIQAAAKIFGFWASEIAQKWDDNDLPEVKQATESILNCVRRLSTSQHIEVQERVRRISLSRESA